MEKNDSNLISDDHEDKFEKMTNILTDIAYLLVFLISIPCLIGLTFAGISKDTDKDGFLNDSSDFGLLFLGISLSFPIFFFLFLKLRKKKIWYEIFPSTGNKELTIGVFVLFLPIFIVSSLYLILSHIFSEPIDAFNIFQLIIYVILPIESMIFLKFFTIQFPILDSAEINIEKAPLNKYNNSSLQKIIQLELGIKIVFDVLTILFTKEPIICLLANLLFILCYFISNKIINSLKKQNSEFKLCFQLKIFGLIFIFVSIIQFASILFSELLEISLYIILISILSVKFLIYEYSNLTKKFNGELSTFEQLGTLINFNLILSVLFYSIGLLTSFFYSMYIPIILSLVSIFIYEFETKKYQIKSKTTHLFLILQLVITNAIFSFAIIKDNIAISFLIFFLISFIITSILYEKGIISKLYRDFLNNILYILIFYEIAIIFALSATNTNNSILISNSKTMTWVFFLSLSSLGSLYRLHAIKAKGTRSIIFSQLIVLFLVINFMGLFQILLDALSSSSIDIYLQIKDIFPSIFSPTGYLVNISSEITSFFNNIGTLSNNTTTIFKSSIGQASIFHIGVVGLVTLFGYHLIISIHKKYDVFPQYSLDFNKVLVHSIFTFLICLSLINIFQSLSGILFSFIIGSIMAIKIIDSVIELKKNKSKDQPSQFQKTKKFFLLLNLILILLFLFTISQEFLLRETFLSLSFTLITFLLVINYTPILLKNIQHEEIKNKVITILNTIILISLGIFIIPTIKNHYSTITPLSFLSNPINFILIAGMNLLLFFILALKQLKSGGYLKSELHSYLKFGFNFIFWVFFLVLCLYNEILQFIPSSNLNLGLLVASILIYGFSFVCKIYQNQPETKKITTIYMFWRYIEGIMFEISMGLLISFGILISHSILSYSNIFLGIFGLLIITKNNVINLSSNYLEKPKFIQSLIEFIDFSCLIVLCGLVYSVIDIIFINLIDIISLNIAALAILCTFIAISIIINNVNLIQKYIKNSIIIVVNSIISFSLLICSILLLNYHPVAISVCIFAFAHINIYLIQKLIELKVHLKKMLSAIVDFLSLLSVATVLLFTITISKYFIGLDISESILISIGILWVLIYSNPLFKKYIPIKYFRLFNAVLMQICSILLVIILNINFKGDNGSVFEIDLISSIAILFSIIFGSLIYGTIQLHKGEFLSDIQYKYVHHILTSLLVVSIYITVLRNNFLYVYITENDGYFNYSLISIGLAFSLYLAFRIIRKSNYYEEFVPLQKSLYIQLIISWINIIFWILNAFNSLITNAKIVDSLYFLIICWGLYHLLKIIKFIIPIKENGYELSKNVLLNLILIGLIWSSYNFLIEFSEVLLQKSPIFTIFLMIIISISIILSIPNFRILYKTILHEILGFLILIGSCFLSISIYLYCTVYHLNYLYSLLLFIPILSGFLATYILSKKDIAKSENHLKYSNNTIRSLYQICFSLLLLNSIFFSFTLSDTYLPVGISSIISILLVSSLLYVDFRSFKWIVNKELESIISFSLVILITSAISASISELMPNNIVESTFNRIILFSYIQLVFMYFIGQSIKPSKSYDYLYNKDTENEEKNIKIEQTLKDNSEMETVEIGYEEKHEQILNTNDNIEENIEVSPENLNSRSIEEDIKITSHEIQERKVLKGTDQFISNFSTKSPNSQNKFIIFALILNICLVFNNIIIPNNIDIFNALIISTLVISVFAFYQHNSNKFLYYYIQSCISIWTISQYSLRGNLLTYVYIVTFVQLIIINRIMTLKKPINITFKYISNISIIALYILCALKFDVGIEWALIIGTICFNYVSKKEYLNFFFRSLKVVAVLYSLFSFSYNILNFDLLFAIEIPLGIALIWEWVICKRDQKWKKTMLRPLLGFATFYLSILIYLSLYWKYSDIMGIITVPLFIINAITLSILKRKHQAFKRDAFINSLILFSVLMASFALGYNFLFTSFNNNLYFSLFLTGIICSFSFIFLFDYLEIDIKNSWKITIISIGSIFTGLLTYLFLTQPTLIPQPIVVAFPISLDFAIVMFFLALGLYQRSFKKIWEFGVYLWILVPIANYFLISHYISDIDSLTNAVSLINQTINGSIIISILACSLLYLPAFLTKFKENIVKMIYVLWVELVALTYWFALNIFSKNTNALVTLSFVILIGLLLLVPIFTYHRQWKRLSCIWPMIAISNIIFFIMYVELETKREIPVVGIILGMYTLALAYFPNIKEKSDKLQSLVIISGYAIILASIFAFLYSIVFEIFSDITLAVNITFIVISFILLTGKYFKIEEKIVKILHSIIIILNLAIFIAREFSLISLSETGGSLTLFGIFIGIAFACGLTLTFQARKYLPKEGFELFWLGMALFFGLSSFELLLSVLSIGFYASFGTLVCVTVLIGFPIFNAKRTWFYILLIFGISFILNEFLIIASPFIANYDVLTLFTMIFLFETIYVKLTSLMTLRVMKEERKNYELIAIMWLILSILLSLTLVYLINFNEISVNIYSDILIFYISFSLQGFLIEKFIRKNEIFYQFEKTQKIIQLLHNIQMSILYVFFAILISIYIPDSRLFENLENSKTISLFFDFSIFFIILFIELILVDEKFFKIVKSKFRCQLQWIVYFLFSNSIILVFILSTNNWDVSLLIWSLLSFGTIYLNKRAENKLNYDLTKIANLCLLNVAIFSIFWKLLNTTDIIGDFELHPLFINISINLLVISLFMILKIIKKDYLKIFLTLFTASVAISCEELLRSTWIDGNANGVYLITLALLVFNLLNIFRIKKLSLVYFFWITIVLSMTATLMLFITYSFEITLTNLIFCMLYLTFLGIILTFFFEKLAEPKEKPLPKSDEIEEKEEKISVLKLKSGDFLTSQKIFVYWSLIEILNLCITIPYLLNLGLTELTNSLPYYYVVSFERYLLMFSIIPLIISLSIMHLARYTINNQIWDNKATNTLKTWYLEKKINYSIVISFNILLLNLFWITFNSSYFIADGFFWPLLLNLSINLSILNHYTQKYKIASKISQLINFISKSLIALLIEEVVRGIIPDFNTIFYCAVFIIAFCLLYMREIKSIRGIYGFWTVISLCLAIFSNELIDRSSLDPELLTSIIIAMFIFGLFTTTFFYCLAHDSFSKISQFKSSLLEKNKKVFDVDTKGQKENSVFQLTTNNILKAHKNYVYWAIIESFILCISFTYLLINIYPDSILHQQISSYERIFSIISLIILVISLLFKYIVGYMIKFQIWDNRANNILKNWYTEKRINIAIVLSMNFLIFISLWIILSIEKYIIALDFLQIMFNLVINFSILNHYVQKYQFTPKIKNIVKLFLKISLAGFIEEGFRSLIGSSSIYNISIFVFVLLVLYIRDIIKIKLIYVFWTTLALCIAIFSYGLFSELAISEKLLYSTFIFGFLNTVFYYGLAHDIFITIPGVQSLFSQASHNENEEKSLVSSISLGNSNAKVAKKIYSNWFFIEILILTVFFTKIISLIFNNAIDNINSSSSADLNVIITHFMSILLWIFTALPIFFILLNYNSNYIRKYQLWDLQKNYFLIRKKSSYNFKVLATLNAMIFCFLHLWFLMRISIVITFNYYQALMLNITICLLIPYILMKTKKIKKQKLPILTFLLSLSLSFYFEELLRTMSELSILFIIAFTLFSITLLNVKKMTLPFMIYIFFGIIILFMSISPFELEIFGLNPLSFNFPDIYRTFCIFSLLYALMALILSTEGKKKKINLNKEPISDTHSNPNQKITESVKIDQTIPHTYSISPSLYNKIIISFIILEILPFFLITNFIDELFDIEIPILILILIVLIVIFKKYLKRLNIEIHVLGIFFYLILPYILAIILSRSIVEPLIYGPHMRSLVGPDTEIIIYLILIGITSGITGLLMVLVSKFALKLPVYRYKVQKPFFLIPYNTEIKNNQTQWIQPQKLKFDAQKPKIIGSIELFPKWKKVIKTSRIQSLASKMCILSITLCFYLFVSPLVSLITSRYSDMSFIGDSVEIHLPLLNLLRISLIILVISIGFLLIFIYIKAHKLWFENIKFEKLIRNLMKIDSIGFYISLPVFISIYLYVFLIDLLGGVNALFIASIAFLLITMINIYFVDQQKTHFFKKQISNIIVAVIIFLLAVDIASLSYILVENVSLSLIVFSIILYTYSYFKVLPENLFIWTRFMCNLLMSVCIILPSLNYLFSFNHNIFISILQTVIILQIYIELTCNTKLLTPLSQSLQEIRKIFFLIFAALLGIFIGFYINETSIPSYYAAGVVLFTALMLRENKLVYGDDTKLHSIDQNNSIQAIKTPLDDKKVQHSQYKTNRQIIAIILYLELIIFCSMIIIPQIVDTIPVDQSKIFIYCLTITIIVLFAYLANLVDKKKFSNIPRKIAHQVDVSLFYSLIILIASDIATGIFLGSTSPSSTTGGGDPSVSLSLLLLVFIVITIIVGLLLILKFKNKKLNQIIYSLISFEIFIELLLQDNNVILVAATLVLLLIYPLIFYLEKVIELVKKLRDYVIIGLEYLVELAQKIKMAAIEFYNTHKRGVYFVLGLIGASLLWIYLPEPNIFVSFLGFLLINYPISPEKEKGNTPKIFLLKIIYRALIVICIIGIMILSGYLPKEAWVYTLLLLAFLGYVLWAVRRSEELYNLPVYWGFLSATATIVDFFITLALVLIKIL